MPQSVVGADLPGFIIGPRGSSVSKHCATTMEWFKFVAFGCIVAVANGVCKDNYFKHIHYKELQCKPLFTSDPECPSSYDCSNLAARKDNKCYYKGKEYDPGAILKQNVLSDSPCTEQCRCMESYNKKAEFKCLTAECSFGPPLEEGCVRQYSSLQQCCSNKIYCRNEKSTVTKCLYKGEEYLEGQTFYPEDEPCKICICKPGFNGTLSEPWCTTISCNYDLHYAGRLAKGCVPLLYKELSCCPIDWKCPNEGNFSIIPGPNTKKGTPSRQNEQCTFGNLKLNIGDQLASKEDEDSTCSCVIPPHLFCVKKQSI